MSDALADTFYRVQIRESKIGWITLLVTLGLTAITIVVVFFTIRAHYLKFVQDSRIGSSFGYMCAFAHVYPFLSGLFFKNPNTPDMVINTYYWNQNGEQWSSENTAGMGGLVDPANWRDAVGTMVWFSESNRNYGYNDVITWATTPTTSSVTI